MVKNMQTMANETNAKGSSSLIKKIISIVLALVVGVVVFAVVARNFIIKTAIEQGVTRVMGFKTKVDSVRFDLPSTIQITGLEIDNPSEFEEKIFIIIPEIYASIVLPELLQGKRIHLPEVRLNISEVHLEKNSAGVSNVEKLTSVQKTAGQKTTAAPPPAEKPSKPAMPFLLERLELTIRNVSFQDRSGILGKAPVNRVAVDLNVQKEVFGNIQDPVVLVNLILVKILQGATFGKLLNLNPQDLLGDNFNQVLSSGKELVAKEAAAVLQQTNQLKDQATGFVKDSQVTQKTETLLKDSLGGAKDTLSGTTDAAQQKLSGFMGKLKSLKPGETDETSSTDNK